MSRRCARLRAVSPVGPGGRRVVESAGLRHRRRMPASLFAGRRTASLRSVPRARSPVIPHQHPASALPSQQPNLRSGLRDNHQRPNETAPTPARSHDTPGSGQHPRPPPTARSFASAQSPRATSAHPPTATRRPVRRTADPLTLIRRLGGPWAWPLSERAAYMPTGSADAHIPPRPRAWPSAAPTAPVALRWRTRAVRSWRRPFTDTVLLARGEGGYAVIDESCRARSTSRRAIPASQGHRPRRNGCCLAGP